MKEVQLRNWKWKITGCILMFFWVSVWAMQVRGADYTSAQTLPLNGAWSSEFWLTEEEGEQWYKIVVPSDGKLTYKVMGYGKVYYDLRDEDFSHCFHSAITSGSESSPNTNTVEQILSKGVYYLDVTGYGKYKLNAAFYSYKTNDAEAESYDSPQRISLGNIVTGAITPTDKEDWYQIYIPANGYYHYKITAYALARYTLYNEDLSKTIYTGRGSTAGSESSPATDEYDIELSPGFYYLKFSYQLYTPGSFGKYIFSFSAINPSNCDHDYNETYIAPTYTSRGYTLYTCPKCGHSYKNEYRAKLVLGTPYVYSLSAGKKKATLFWSSVDKASGYQISYKIKGKAKTVKVKGRTKTRKTIKKLKSKKKCTMRIRAYKKVGKTIVYSKYSSRKTVKIR